LVVVKSCQILMWDGLGVEVVLPVFLGLQIARIDHEVKGLIWVLKKPLDKPYQLLMVSAKEMKRENTNEKKEKEKKEKEKKEKKKEKIKEDNL
jgi:hypothetical protein